MSSSIAVTALCQVLHQSDGQTGSGHSTVPNTATVLKANITDIDPTKSHNVDSAAMRYVFENASCF